MSWLPWLQTSPAKSMITFGTRHMQATLVLLNLGLAAGASFGYKFGQMFTLCFHTHSLIIASVIHPLRHVTAAGWVMRLWEVTAETGRPAALGAGAHATNVLLAQDLVTALRVGTPGQVGAALHEAPQKGTVIFGNGVLIGEDVVKELGGGLSPTVSDRTVAAHHQILFDTSSEVLLPAGLMGNKSSLT